MQPLVSRRETGRGNIHLVVGDDLSHRPSGERQGVEGLELAASVRGQVERPAIPPEVHRPVEHRTGVRGEQPRLRASLSVEEVEVRVDVGAGLHEDESLVVATCRGDRQSARCLPEELGFPAGDSVLIEVLEARVARGGEVQEGVAVEGPLHEVGPPAGGEIGGQVAWSTPSAVGQEEVTRPDVCCVDQLIADRREVIARQEALDVGELARRAPANG
jgi:hypothetical protein